MRASEIGAAAERSGRPGLYDVEIVRDCAIPCCDGVVLAGDLWRPQDAPPRPALVTLLPYHKDGLGGISSWDINNFFAANGFPSLLVDFRGTGGSGGLPRAAFDPGEALDGVDVVEWAAAQPWCDGSVGMWGASYGATAALKTAAAHPPSLRAIIAVMGFLDAERDFVHPAGRRGSLGSLGIWGLQTLAQYLQPPLRQSPDGEWQRRWRERLDHGEPYVIDMLTLEPGDPRWREREISASEIAVPTFCVAGWQDLYCDAQIRAYEQIRAPKQLLVGPWMHTLPDESTMEPVDFPAIALEWWQSRLDGADQDHHEDETATFYVQGQGVWRQAATWPGSQASVISMAASANGDLVAETPPQAGTVTKRPNATVGIHSGLYGMPTRGFGRPGDQHDDDACSIAFTTPPLGDKLLICGRPRVLLRLADESQSARTFVVKIADVAANGQSLLITSGVSAALVDEAPPTKLLAIDLASTAYEVGPGHRLRLVVSRADFPRLWPDTDSSDISVVAGPDATSLEIPTTTRLGEIFIPPRPPADKPRGSLVMRSDPLYTVTRNPVTETVTVTVGDHLYSRTPDNESTLDYNAYVSNTVAADRPDGAFLSGKATIHLDTPRGEFVVGAEMLVSAETAVLTGDVSFAGQSLVSRRWTI